MERNRDLKATLIIGLANESADCTVGGDNMEVEISRLLGLGYGVTKVDGSYIESIILRWRKR